MTGNSRRAGAHTTQGARRPLVDTTAGPVRGIEEDGILAFLGVPYAAPIVAGNRFSAPEPPEAWDEPRAADALSGVCPQLPTYGPVGHGASSSIRHASDFLTVNVRTPSLSGAAPVLVWIHGGGYAVGSANEPQLQTGAFARSGVVEVTVNYRLGALGFAHLPGRPDNRGLLDQIAALAWVRDNIARFGGDPSRVTLAGRSAGGFSVATLLAMPPSFGLYRRALAQSGAAIAVIDRTSAERVTQRLATAAGCTVEELEALPIDALLDAQKTVCDESYDHHDVVRDGPVTMVGIPFQAVIDGASLPEHPEAAAAAGRTAPVPLVTGCTTAEYLTHSRVLPGDVSFEDVARRVHDRVVPRGLTGAEIVTRYRDALPSHSAAGIWRAVCGDLVFQNPTRELADAHRGTSVYLYGIIDPDETGHAHGAEVPQVWHRDDGRQDGLPARAVVDDHEGARRVHETWVRMVTGDIDLPDWLPGPGERGGRLLRILPDGATRVEPDPFAARRGLWQPGAETAHEPGSARPGLG